MNLLIECRMGSVNPITYSSINEMKAALDIQISPINATLMIILDKLGIDGEF